MPGQRLDGASGKVSPDMFMSHHVDNRLQRRQKQNQSLLIPSERISKLTNYSQAGAQRVSLKSLATPNETSAAESAENFGPPRVGRSIALAIKQFKGGARGAAASKLAMDDSNKISNGKLSAMGHSRQSSTLQQPRFEESSQFQTPKDLHSYISLNNSIAVEDFKSNLASPPRDINNFSR